MLPILSTFTFIFLAALPGRTTFLMMLMAARGRPWQIFGGAILAFGIHGAISVALGNLVHLLPEWAIHTATGLLFSYFAIQFWRESQRSIEAPAAVVSWRSAFTIIFAAEWGDVSQIAIASVAANSADKLRVFLAATLALWVISGMAVFVGVHLGKAINQGIIQKAAAVGFLMVATYFFFRVAT